MSDVAGHILHKVGGLDKFGALVAFRGQDLPFHHRIGRCIDIANANWLAQSIIRHRVTNYYTLTNNIEPIDG